MRPPCLARCSLSLITLCSVMRGSPSPAWAQESTRYLVNAELGTEYDTNAHRTEEVEGAVDSPPIVSSPVVRAVLSGTLSDVIADGQVVTVSAMGAGKAFTVPEAARTENVAVAQTTAGWRLALGRRANVGVNAIYYEAFQRSSGDPEVANERRDFRSITSTLRFGRPLGQHAEIGAGVGYRLFDFKSDLDFSFRAPLGSIDLRWIREAEDGGADWELGAGSALELRAFQGRTLVHACAPSDVCPPIPGLSQRRDNFLTGHVEVARTATILMGVGYSLHQNWSNSYGETVTRHFATLRLTAPLPAGLYLAARAELLIATYKHPPVVGEQRPDRSFPNIESENRSSVRVDLSRALTDRLQLLARYTLYVNELVFATPAARFRRQTAMLSLAFTIDK